MNVLPTFTRTLLALILACFLQVSAEEPQPETPPESVFTKADVNNDGRLGPGEVKNKTLFKRMDANSNGFVSAKEIGRAHV